MEIKVDFIFRLLIIVYQLNMDEPVFLLQEIFLFECIPKSDIARTNSSIISRFLRNLRTDFHSNYQFAFQTEVDICTFSLTFAPAFAVIDFLMIAIL